MAARLRPVRRLDRKGAGTARERKPKPRRKLQLLVWAFVLVVFSGFSIASGQTGHGSHSVAAAAVPTYANSVSQPHAHALAAGSLPALLDGGGGQSSDQCKKITEAPDFLPIQRWTSFNLSVVDNARIIKTRLFMTMISSLMFAIGSLMWRLIGLLMGFSYTYDTLCSVAPQINSAAGLIAQYMAWFLIPMWLIVLAAVAKQWSGGGGKGPGSAVRLLGGFLAATGMIFFIVDQSAQHDKNPLAAYTAPWMAFQVQGWFDSVSKALNPDNLAKIQPDQKASAFYDTNANTSPGMSCANLDAQLYTDYAAENKQGVNGNLSDGGVTVMQEVSHIWEVAFLRSWEAAQFGTGSSDYPAPARAACRMLEGRSSVPVEKKWRVYDESVGLPVGSSNGTKRGFYISPTNGYQNDEIIAWSACIPNKDGNGSSGVIQEWSGPVKPYTSGGLFGTGLFGTGGHSFKNSCEELLSKEKKVPDPPVVDFGDDSGPLNAFYFNGSDELNGSLGGCMDKPNCQELWTFISGWLGANESERLTMGLMSMIVAIVFLLVLGPMALGLTVISDALAIMVILLAVTFALLAIGSEQGKKMAKLTGACAAGKFIFTMLLTLLMVVIQITFAAVTAAVGTNAPSFTEQALEAASPLIALFLFKKLTQSLGLGDIGSLRGSFGLAGAAVLRAAGSNSAPGMRAGHGAGAMLRDGLRTYRRWRRHRQIRDLLRNKQQQPQSPLLQTPGVPGQGQPGGALGGLLGSAAGADDPSAAKRAASFAGLAAAFGTEGLLAPELLPVLLAGAAVLAAGAGGYALYRRHKAKSGLQDGESADTPGLEPGAAAGLALTQDADSARRNTAEWHRMITKVAPGSRGELESGRVDHALDLQRGMLWGAKHPNGINPDFAGFPNAEALARARTELAEAMGIPENALVVGQNGLALPVPVLPDQNGQRTFVSKEQLVHPINYLDSGTVMRQVVDGVEESDEQWLARVTAQIRDRGYITDDGRTVDVLAANGIDVNDPRNEERIAAVIRGGHDPDISNIVIQARRPENLVVQAAYKWDDRQLGSTIQIEHERSAEAVIKLRETATREIGDFSRIELQRPDGSAANAGQIRIELEQKFGGMEDVVGRIQSLYREQASLGRQEFEVKLSGLNELHNNYAQDIDRLTESIRDAFDSSAAARSVCELRVQLADATVTTDTSAVAETAQRINDDLVRQRQALHEAIEKEVGAISRMPADLSQAEAAVANLNEFHRLIADRIAAEEQHNQQVITQLAETERIIAERQHLALSDPHRTVARPSRARDLVAGQHPDRELSKL